MFRGCRPLEQHSNWEPSHGDKWEDDLMDALGTLYDVLTASDFKRFMLMHFYILSFCKGDKCGNWLSTEIIPGNINYVGFYSHD